MLVEANRLVAYGDNDGARQILENLYADHPNDEHVLIDLGAFYVDQGELDNARPIVESLRTLELGTNDSRRAEDVERDYLEAIYGLSRGDGPANPADPVAYEETLIARINLDEGHNEDVLAEYIEFLVIGARRALDVPIDERIPVSEDEDGPIDRATPEQARAALEYFSLLQGRDERLEIELELPSEIRREIRQTFPTLELKVFLDSFDTAWRDQHRRRFENEGRFSTATGEFTISFAGELMPDLTEDTTVERLTGRAQTVYAREIATDLAYELSEVERGDDEPLPYRLDDFADARATNARVGEDGLFHFDVTIPYLTVRKGALLLRERRVERGEIPEPAP